MSHTIVTTTTTTTTSTIADSGIIDMGYVRSFQAMLKIAQIVVLLIAFLCVHCAAWTDYSAYRYFEVVTVWFLITFLIFYIMYVFRLQKKIPCINWPLTEFLHYAIGTLLIFIASIVAAVNSQGYAGLVAGSFFGFFATVLLAMSIWMSYKITCGSQPTSAAV